MCVNALRGTAFAGVTLLARFDAEILPASAFVGAVIAPDVGVYAAAAVTAFEPAETELDDA
jgi:hypothetical protein